MHFCSLSSSTYYAVAGLGFWPYGGGVRKSVTYLIVFGHILIKMCLIKKSLEKGAKMKKFNLRSAKAIFYLTCKANAIMQMYHSNVVHDFYKYISS